jgi:tetratricopeptide (TPR) repeat protein
VVNYYELLEIPQSADKAAIEQAIRKTRRVWNNRANNPDAAIRAEAEMHVKEIADAEKILLDENKRQAYDEQLRQAPKNDGVDQIPEDNSDWEAEFFKAYDRNMNDYAAQVAQREIRLHEKNGRAWFLYGEALRRCGNLAEGIDAMKRASLFVDDDPGIYRQLGFAYADCNQYGEAYKAFKVASQIDPSNYEYHCLAANCLRNDGMITEAIAEAKIAYSMNSNDEQVKFEYFVALYEDAMKAMSYNRSSGKHLIINRRQLDYINDILKIMSVVVPKNDDRCTRVMEDIVQIVVDAESTKGGGFLRVGKPGYEYNYEISNSDTRSTGLH